MTRNDVITALKQLGFGPNSSINVSADDSSGQEEEDIDINVNQQRNGPRKSASIEY